MTTTRVPPLTVIEPARVLRSGDTPGDDSGGRRGRPVAISGLDGTLTRTDTLLPFLRRIAGTSAVVGTLAVAASRELPRRNRRDAAKALVLQRTLGGRPLTEVDQVARGYAARLFARLRPDSLARWSWHRRQGHRLVIASASPGLYVHHLGRQLDADAVICTEMTVVSRWPTSRSASPRTAAFPVGPTGEKGHAAGRLCTPRHRFEQHHRRRRRMIDADAVQRILTVGQSS